MASPNCRCKQANQFKPCIHNAELVLKNFLWHVLYFSECYLVTLMTNPGMKSYVAQPRFQNMPAESLHTLFGDRLHPERFLVSCLCIDSSKAGSKNVTLKPMVTCNAKGEVGLQTLNADFVFSKKGAVSAEHSLRSFAKESDYRFEIFICAVTCDAFGVKEAKEILKRCDAAAVLMHSTDPTILTYPKMSEVLPLVI